jgi:hypothetical protein
VNKVFKIGLSAILLALLLVTASLAVNADPITLTDAFGPNSTVNIDATTQAGVYEWIIDGVNHMSQNSYWFRIGDGPITPITALGAPTITPVLDMMCEVLYSGQLFDAKISYMLMGADEDSGQSDLAQILSITNNSDSVLDLHFYEYINLDLNGTAAGQVGTLDTSSTFTQTFGSTESMLSFIDIPDLIEIGDATTLLGKLNGNISLVANDYYAGDVACIAQWNVYLDDSWMMSQDNALFADPTLPEPASIFALAGMIGLLPLMRRRKN